MAFGLSSMSSANRTWILKIVADVNEAKQGIESVDKTTQGFAANAKKLGGAVVGALGTVAVVEFGKSIVQAASDTEQSLGAARSVFKEFSGEIEAYGKDSAKNLGVSNQEFLQLSSLMGSLLKNAGVPLQQTTKMTEQLTQRASDLAAMYGGNVSDAVNAVNSALKGEYDPLESFGVSLRASTIDARAMAEGYVDAEGKVTAAGRAIAAQELILEQSADAAGTFAKESGSLAGQTQIMQAQFKDLQAQLGQKLLPVIVDLMKVIRPLLEFIANNTSWLIPLAGIIGGIVLAVKAWTVAQAAFNIVMAANPIVLLVLAIGALVAALVLAYQKVEWFRNAVDAVFRWIRDNWPILLGILTGPFGAAAILIVRNWDSVLAFFRNIPGWINDAFRGLYEILIYPFVRAGKAVIEAFSAVGDWFYRLPGRIQGWLSGLGDIITWPFRAAWGHIEGTFKAVTDWFYRLPGRIQGFFGNLADIITWPFRKAFDGIKWLWNSTIGGFGFTIPAWLNPFGGAKEFRIPKMASGGIVSRPTLALIGEAGPEAVVPLSQMGSMPGQATAQVVNINVYALTANAEVGRRVYEAMAEFQRVSGRGVL